MYPVISRCPVCQGELTVTHLQCRACGTEVVGSFRQSRFSELSPRQMEFLELLVKHRGNISKIAEELKVAFPTARSRLDDLVRGMGYEIEDEGVVLERRREILSRVASGEISAEEAARQLRG